MAENLGEIIIYQTDDGLANINVKIQDETVWLTQQQMAELYQTSRTNVVEHIKHIYEEQELDEESTCRNFRQVRKEGNREVARELTFYNLDMIISLGYRIKSRIATQFRRWATERIKEYMIKGFTMDDERLKGYGGGNYWKELLDRIRDIRSSEKVLYRQVLDLYATSVDYDPKSEDSIKFFKIVQNKLHFAAHGHTAAELIYERADAEKPFMGLTSFVSGYFDLAEISAIEHKPMYMSDYVAQLDAVLTSGGRKLLGKSGKVSHDEAMKKAKTEYRKYQEITLSPVEEAYMKTIHDINATAKKEVRKSNRR